MPYIWFLTTRDTVSTIHFFAKCDLDVKHHVKVFWHVKVFASSICLQGSVSQMQSDDKVPGCFWRLRPPHEDWG